MKCKQCNNEMLSDFTNHISYCKYCGSLKTNRGWYHPLWNAYENTITALKLLRNNIDNFHHDFTINVWEDGFNVGLERTMDLIDEMIGVDDFA